MRLNLFDTSHRFFVRLFGLWLFCKNIVSGICIAGLGHGEGIVYRSVLIPEPGRGRIKAGCIRIVGHWLHRSVVSMLRCVRVSLYRSMYLNDFT